jgi:NAD(P)H-flavin reductase
MTRMILVAVPAFLVLALAFPAPARAFSYAFGPVGLTSRLSTSSARSFLPPLRSASVHMGSTVSRARIAVLRMNAASDFMSGSVVSNEEGADGLRVIKVEVPKDVVSGYTTPGQYVKMRKDSSMEKPGFFAMASAPSGGRMFEFLIKRTEGSAWICDAKKGGTIDVSPAQGKGYKYADAFGPEITDVILLATGSGVAPLKAVVESKALSSKNVKLYYGAQTPTKMAFQGIFSMWENDCGATIIPTISKPEGTNWDGRTGYVQKCMMEDGIKSPASTGVLICGVNDMVKEAKEMLLEAGVKPEMVLMNF